MSEIINETINELNKPTQNNVFSIEDDPVTVLEKINQVERYLKQIDTRVDTSINTANEAMEKANNAFEANGTLVKINGENQLTWSADFAESERQKSKNLLDINKAEFKGESSTYSTLSGGTITINAGNQFCYISSLTNLCDLKPNIPYTLSYVTNNGYSYIYQYTDGATGFTWNNGETKTFTQTELDSIANNLLLLYGSADSTVTYSNIQIEEGSTATDYQSYSGAIVHKSDIEPVLIYDIDTKNTIGGTAYTNGVKFGANTQINVAGYSKIKTYSRVYNTYNITEVTLDKTGWTGNSFMIFDGVPAIKNVGIMIYNEGVTITPAECYNFSDSTTLNNNDNAYVYRIEGVI